MRRIAAITRNPVAIALVAMLAVAGCANKNTPNNAADLGLGAGSASPGSTQDFTVNVGDRIFFDTDSSSIRADAQQTLTGPHFGASQQISPPGAVQATAGTANTRSEREDSPAVSTADQAVAPPQRASAQGGLLDRVLVAMEREKRR